MPPLPVLAPPRAGAEDSDADTATQRRGIRLDEMIAVLAILLIGLKQEIAGGLTIDVVFNLLIAPLWITTLGRFRGGYVVTAAGVLAISWGLAMSVYAEGHYTINPIQRTQSTLLFASIVLGIAVVMWARTVISWQLAAALFGVGMTFNKLLNVQNTPNAWKFVWAVPIAVVLLSITGNVVRRSVIALLVLAAASALFDSRSFLGTFVIAALLVLWQARPRGRSRSGSATRTVLYFAALGTAVYYLLTGLLTSGLLGEETQQRTEAQIQQSGSLILGGRPELTATIELMRIKPWGFGVGVVPNLDELNAVKTAMASINYDPNNGYVDRFMFGERIELHSNIGDLWAQWGMGGVLFGIVIIIRIISMLAGRIAAGTAPALFVFLGCLSLWHMCFSPLESAQPTIILTVALGAAPILHRSGGSVSDPASDVHLQGVS